MSAVTPTGLFFPLQTCCPELLQDLWSPFSEGMVCLEVMDACQLVFAGLLKEFVLRKGSGEVVCPPQTCTVTSNTHSDPPCLLILPEVHKLQEMMGTAPGHTFWVRFSNLCSLWHRHSQGCPEPTGGPVMALAVSPFLLCGAVTSGFSLWICVSWCCFWHCCSKCAATVHMLSLCW